MPFLKSRRGHAKSCFGLYWYLIKSKQNKDRVLAADYINMAPSETELWYQIMDETRVENGNNRDWGGIKARTYNHFIISPNPADSIDLDTLRYLATEWAYENFSDYEIAVIYHDDNRHHIPHAHVVVNNTNLSTGRRCHISNGENDRLKNRVQELAKEFGLRYFDNERGDNRSSLHIKEAPQTGFSALSLGQSEEYNPSQKPATKQPDHKTLQAEYRTYAERHNDGKHYLWKDDIRARVDIAFRMAQTIDGFLETCSMLELTVSRNTAGNDYQFALLHQPTRCVNGSTLGASYTPEGIQSRLLSEIRSEKSRSINSSIDFTHYIESFRESAGKPIGYVRSDDGTTLKDVADCLSFMETYGIRSTSDIDSIISGLPRDDDASDALQKIRQITIDAGIIPTTSEPADRFKYQLPANLDTLSRHELAKTIRDAYASLGYGSGNVRSAGTSGRSSSGSDPSHRNAPTKHRSKGRD